MNDGIVLTYIKDNILYPVGITKEQNDMIQIIVPHILGKVTVIKDKPLGEAINYTEEDK